MCSSYFDCESSPASPSTYARMASMLVRRSEAMRPSMSLTCTHPHARACTIHTSQVDIKYVYIYLYIYAHRHRHRYRYTHSHTREHRTARSPPRFRVHTKRANHSKAANAVTAPQQSVMQPVRGVHKYSSDFAEVYNALTHRQNAFRLYLHRISQPSDCGQLRLAHHQQWGFNQ